MLSLKDNLTILSKPSKKITDIPREILDIILDHVLTAGCDKVSAILPVSLACQQLRSAAVPILFKHVVVVVDSQGLRGRSQNALHQLSAAPHLLQHVRHLYIFMPIRDYLQQPSNPTSHYASSLQLLSLTALQMTGLKQIRLDHLSNLTVDLLQSLAVSNKPDLRLTLDLNRVKHDLCDSTSISQCRALASQCQWSMDVSFPLIKHDFTRQAVVELALPSRNIIALNCYQISHLTQYLVGSSATLSRVRELNISTMQIESLPPLLSSSNIPWGKLQKLTVEGDAQIESLFSSGFERMLNLTHLRLSPTRTTVFHPLCDPNSSNLELAEKLPFTHLKHLQHLELFTICNHLSMEQITTPALRSLRIQFPEHNARIADLEPVRPLADIRWLAKNVPHLERLELHIGDLHNLWNPAAIPGVDVDVEVYQTLQALSTIPNLRQLRLFPPYVPRKPRVPLMTARQPLSDEQAVRIFQHLRAQRPTLDMLCITATFESLSLFHPLFHPMSWTVHSAGDTTVLTTRQAERYYEIEQTWVGERRTDISTTRDTYNHPYLPDLGEWTYRLSRKTDLPLVGRAYEDEEDED